MQHLEDVALGGEPPRASVIGASVEAHFARIAGRADGVGSFAVLEIVFGSLDELAGQRGQWTAETVLDEVAQRFLRAEVGLVRIDHAAHELVAVAAVDELAGVLDEIRSVLSRSVRVADIDVAVDADIKVSPVAPGQAWPSALGDHGEAWVERRAIRSARLYVRDASQAGQHIEAVRHWCGDVTVVSSEQEDSAERFEDDLVVALPTLVIDRRGMPTRHLVGDLDDERLRRELG